jgi:pimeloyl-ACP methyl ester carboxylesterase
VWKASEQGTVHEHTSAHAGRQTSSALRAQAYTTALWKSYVRDFVVHVVGEPVFIAGNSIGGVIPANSCADHPHLFKGIVLINTAGSADTDFDPDAPMPEKKAQSKAFVNATSWLTFRYLQSGIAAQLRKLYPTRPHNADKFLNDEIYRASCDPCALQARSHCYSRMRRHLSRCHPAAACEPCSCCVVSWQARACCVARQLQNR